MTYVNLMIDPDGELHSEDELDSPIPEETKEDERPLANGNNYISPPINTHSRIINALFLIC